MSQKIEGIVYGNPKKGTNPAPLKDAQIAINGMGISKVTKSHGDGKFEFEHLPGGLYTLTISRPGYQTDNRTMNLNQLSNKPLSVTIYLMGM